MVTDFQKTQNTCAVKGPLFISYDTTTTQEIMDNKEILKPSLLGKILKILLLTEE